MKRQFLACALLLILTGCNQEASDQTSTQLSEQFDESGIPSAIMGSIHSDGTEHWRAFGPAIWDETGTVNENNIFRIYSMTKALTSVAAMQLVEQGEIGLDEPLNDLMPEMASIPILTENGELISSDRAITLRHLLTHTAGFGYDFTSPRLQAFQPENWEYEDKPRLFEPGTSWRYGTNTDWVGRVVEKISGKTLEQYFRDNITGPLGMDATWFNVPENLQDRIVSWGVKDSSGFQKNPRLPEAEVTTFSGGGGLYGSPKDYLTFLTCMLNYGEYDGGRILERESVELMMEDNLPEEVSLDFVRFENGVSSNSGDFNDESDRWGLAWALESNENETIRPQGAAYWAGAANSFYTLDLENQIAVVYFTQYFPFNDKATVDLYRLYEKSVYDGQTM